MLAKQSLLHRLPVFLACLELVFQILHQIAVYQVDFIKRDERKLPSLDELLVGQIRNSVQRLLFIVARRVGQEIVLRYTQVGNFCILLLIFLRQTFNRNLIQLVRNPHILSEARVRAIWIKRLPRAGIEKLVVGQNRWEFDIVFRLRREEITRVAPQLRLIRLLLHRLNSPNLLSQQKFSSS